MTHTRFSLLQYSLLSFTVLLIQPYVNLSLISFILKNYKEIKVMHWVWQCLTPGPMDEKLYRLPFTYYISPIPLPPSIIIFMQLLCLCVAILLFYQCQRGLTLVSRCWLSPDVQSQFCSCSCCCWTAKSHPEYKITSWQLIMYMSIHTCLYCTGTHRDKISHTHTHTHTHIYIQLGSIRCYGQNWPEFI